MNYSDIELQKLKLEEEIKDLEYALDHASSPQEADSIYNELVNRKQALIPYLENEISIKQQAQQQ